MTSDLDPNVVAWIALGAAFVAVIALIFALINGLRLRRMRAQYELLQGDDGKESFVTAVSRKAVEVEKLRDDVERTRSRVESLRLDLADAIRHVAVVRYDAFNDMGGRMSFSAALLDDAGDGLVISSINGRTETRTYAKGVKGGASDALLSPEEEQVIGYAQRGTDSN
ncbi:MAG TPA: DUF4446 family protein [Actinomycetes bacterium]|nr:DUF4446 family protein [Actinomycetes bacterium]